MLMPIWGELMDTAKYRNTRMVKHIQGSGLIRMVRAYKTVSNYAFCGVWSATYPFASPRANESI